jgi:hypothetical protein
VSLRLVLVLALVLMRPLGAVRRAVVCSAKSPAVVLSEAGTVVLSRDSGTLVDTVRVLEPRPEWIAIADTGTLPPRRHRWVPAPARPSRRTVTSVGL